MRVFVFILFAVAGCFTTMAQNRIIDSLKDELKKEETDTVRAHTLYFLSYYYQRYKPDSALLLAQEAYTLSTQSDYILGQSSSLGQMAGAFNRLGNFPKALEYYIEQLKILEKERDAADIASTYSNIAVLYNSQKDTEKALYYAYKADSLARNNDLKNQFLYTSLNIGDIYFNNNQLDSALLYTSRCYDEAVKQKNDLLTGNALN